MLMKSTKYWANTSFESRIITWKLKHLTQYAEQSFIEIILIEQYNIELLDQKLKNLHESYNWCFLLINDVSSILYISVFENWSNFI